MTNPLTTLDELIWKQFEKVTIAAEKRFGWDKWDLAKITGAAGTASLTGAGTYLFINGTYADSPASTGLYLGMGSIVTLFGGLLYYASSHIIKVDKKREEEILAATEAVPSPRFDFFRPLGLAIGLGFLMGAAYRLQAGADNVTSSFSALTIKEYNFLSGLSFSTMGLADLFCSCSSYFRSQLPRRPSTAKKSLWQALTGYVTKPFHKEQQPAEVPAAKYAAERGVVVAGPSTSRA